MATQPAQQRGFVAINRPLSPNNQNNNNNNSRQSRSSVLLRRVRVKRTPERKQARLRPHDIKYPDGTNASLSQRFFWNLAFWLNDRITSNKALDDVMVLEDLIAGTLHDTPSDNRPHNPDNSLTQEEDDYAKNNGVSIEKYRYLRARQWIGSACIYEHNVRIGLLQQRPRGIMASVKSATNTRRTWSYLNIGVSQAQMICHGTDVHTSALVFNKCKDMNLLPARDTLKSLRWSHPFDPSGDNGPRLEAMFPPQTRQRLYQDYINWYNEIQVPGELRLYISSAVFGRNAPTNVTDPAVVSRNETAPQETETETQHAVAPAPTPTPHSTTRIPIRSLIAPSALPPPGTIHTTVDHPIKVLNSASPDLERRISHARWMDTIMRDA